MKRLLTILLGVLLVMGTASSASAYSYYDIVPNQPDPYYVNPGDPFSVSIYMKGDGADTWNNYTFDIGWDDLELALQSIDPLGAEEFWPSGFSDGFGGPISYNGAEGTIEDFDGYSFNPDDWLHPDETGILLGTIDFTVLTPVGDGLDDVWIHYRTGQGPILTWNGPDLAQVPIPGALWLFGSGLLGLMGIRRCARS